MCSTAKLAADRPLRVKKSPFPADCLPNSGHPLAAGPRRWRQRRLRLGAHPVDRIQRHARRKRDGSSGDCRWALRASTPWARARVISPRSSLSRAAPDDDDTNAASECCEDRSCKRLVEGQRQAAKKGGEKNQQDQLAFNAIHCQLLPVLSNIARPLMVTREPSIVKCGRARRPGPSRAPPSHALHCS